MYFKNLFFFFLLKVLDPSKATEDSALVVTDENKAMKRKNESDEDEDDDDDEETDKKKQKVKAEGDEEKVSILRLT